MYVYVVQVSVCVLVCSSSECVYMYVVQVSVCVCVCSSGECMCTCM